MAGKRSATHELNDRNWDVEDIPEDAGTFKKAPEDVIKNRVIKTAKRRNPAAFVQGDEKKSVFGSFTGFTKPTTESPKKGFSFLSTLKSNEEPKTNGSFTDSGAGLGVKDRINVETATAKVDESKNSTENDTENSKYYAKLKGLNESVSKWIKQHIDENPFVSLQPIFKDYEKYYGELEKEHKQTSDKVSALGAEKKEKTAFTSFTFKPANKVNPTDSTEKPMFSFGCPPKKPENDKAETSEKPTFSFASSVSETDSSNKKTDGNVQKFSFGISTANASKSFNSSEPKFSFGVPNSTKETASEEIKPFSFATANENVGSGFQFGASSSFPKPSTNPVFSFASPKSTKSEEPNPEKEDDDEPPKVEFTPVVEEGHVYTTRCKVFVKKDKTFGDRGVGNLYLKPVPDSEKTQLVVRADTNLGNLLCNFILSDSIPIQKMGKKDVMLICIPTPDSKPPPVPILLRVKSSEEADELLKTLEKYKK